MLGEEEKEEIRKEAERYLRPKAASVAALKIVQKHHGWVAPEALGEVAELLGMTPDELEGVATFFSHIYLKPVGRHVIFVCDSISCWVAGYEELMTHLEECWGIRPGETTPDGRFTMMPIACLGICEEAPAVMIDATLHTGLDKGKLDDILKQYE